MITSRNIDISIDEFKTIRDFIYDKSGMYFPDSKKYLLDDRISKRMSVLDFDKFDKYFYYIKYDSSREAELTKLFDEVTINETSFYRNLPQITALQKSILPELIEAKKAAGSKSLKIWSAACSSGEEPYTIAIVLREILGITFSTWDIDIIATDISSAIIDKAKEGKFNKNALRNTPQGIIDKYFTERNGSYYINLDIKKRVNFQNLNLVDRMKMRMIRNVDVVFCRNVLIYFDLQSKKRVVSSLYNSLANNGYLFIGHSESLHGVSAAFKLVHLTNTMVYKKTR